ncbi:MAG: CAP domain-containing protein [Candidatus Acidiferrales bacterium]
MANPSPRAIPLEHRFFRACAVSLLVAALFCDVILANPLVSGNGPRTASARYGELPKLKQLELQMWELINHDRTAPSCMEETQGRARPLQWDGRLAAVARAHSREMVSNRYFSHESTDGRLPAVRISRAGIQWRSIGENIAQSRDIAGAEVAFMNEPKFKQNHRGNILNPNYTHVGVGIAEGPDGTLYITQDFVQLP